MIDPFNAVIQILSAIPSWLNHFDSRKSGLIAIGNFCETYLSASRLHIKLISSKRIHIKSICISEHRVSQEFDSEYAQEIRVSHLVDPQNYCVIDLFVQPPLTGNQPIVLKVGTDRRIPFLFSLSPIDFGEHRSYSWPTPLIDDNGEIMAKPLDITEEFEALNMQFPPSEIRP